MTIPINRTLYSLFFLIIIISSSCEKIKEAAEFDVLYSVPEVQVTVDSTILEVTDNALVILEKNISIDLDSIRQKHSLESFEEAMFDYIRIELVSPANADLKWISSLRAVVWDANSGEREVATYNSNGEAVKNIDMVLQNVSVKDYIMNQNFTLRIYATTAPPLVAPEVTFKLKSRIRITVQPL